MTRLASIVALAFGLSAVAAEPEKDFKAVSVDGEDVAVISTQKQTRGTRVRLKLVARGQGGAVRVGVARTVEAGVLSMTVWDSPAVNVQISEIVSTDGLVAIAAGPKDTPLKLEKIENDPVAAGATKLSFEGGLVLQVTLVPPRAITTRPQP